MFDYFFQAKTRNMFLCCVVTTWDDNACFSQCSQKKIQTTNEKQETYDIFIYFKPRKLQFISHRFYEHFKDF